LLLGGDDDVARFYSDAVTFLLLQQQHWACAHTRVFAKVVRALVQMGTNDTTADLWKRIDEQLASCSRWCVLRACRVRAACVACAESAARLDDRSRAA
jgi:hypothetical protein